MRRAAWIKALPTQEELCDLFEHAIDENGHGHLIMRKDYPWCKNGKKAGEVARSKMVHGYSRVRFNGTIYYEHKIVWKMVHGTDPVNDIDHINGIRQDNRPNNLRDVLTSQNMRNKINNTEHPGIQETAAGYYVVPMSLSLCNLDLALEFQQEAEALLLPLIRQYKARNMVAIPSVTEPKKVSEHILSLVKLKPEYAK